MTRETSTHCRNIYSPRDPGRRSDVVGAKVQAEGYPRFMFRHILVAPSRWFRVCDVSRRGDNPMRPTTTPRDKRCKFPCSDAIMMVISLLNVSFAVTDQDLTQLGPIKGSPWCCGDGGSKKLMFDVDKAPNSQQPGNFAKGPPFRRKLASLSYQNLRF